MSVDAVSWALKAQGVSPRAKLVLIGLADSADKDGWDCYPGRKTLAEAGACSLDTVDRALRELIDAGLIEVTNRVRETKAKTSNHYIINPSRISAASRENAVTTPSRKGAAIPAADMRPPMPHSHAATLAASDAATYEPPLNLSVVEAERRARTELWHNRLVEAKLRAGEALNTTHGLAHTWAALQAIVEVDGCDWDSDVLPSIDALAASFKAKGKLFFSWGLARDGALTNRDRRARPPAPVNIEAERPRIAANGNGRESAVSTIQRMIDEGRV